MMASRKSNVLINNMLVNMYHPAYKKPQRIIFFSELCSAVKSFSHAI